MVLKVPPRITHSSTHLPMSEEYGTEDEVGEEDTETGGDGDGDKPDVLHQLELDHFLFLGWRRP